MSGAMSGRLAVVTGATSGIGRAASIALARGGWRVLLCGRDQERGREVEQEVGATASGGAFFRVDLTEDGAAEQVRDRVAAESLGLGLLVNSAGILTRGNADQVSAQAFDSTMVSNVGVPFRLAQALLPAMRESGGATIINVSSEAGLRAMRGSIAYATSKAALIMLTRCLAVDHAEDGIRAVSVCPGTTLTPMVERVMASAPDPEAHRRWAEQRRPLGRLGTAEEIAAAIVYVAGPDAAYMTGTELVLDGGYTAAGPG